MSPNIATDLSGASRASKKQERRRTLPTQELWKANISALDELHVSGCHMRYSLVEEKLVFLLQFHDDVPQGRLNLVFPVVVSSDLSAAGFKRFNLTVECEKTGELGICIVARFERENVPLHVRVEVQRTIGRCTGIGKDVVTYMDLRNGEQIETSMKEILELRLKDGSPKYCRRDDTVRELSVEGIVAILGRFLKDTALRRRLLRR